MLACGGGVGDFADLVVAHGGKVIIPKTDGVERVGLNGADQFVDGGSERGAGVGGADGDGDRDMGRAHVLEREHGDAETVAGGETIIDEDEAAMRQIGRRAFAAIQRFAPAELGGFASDDVGDDFLWNALGSDERVVEQLDSTARDCADGEFGIGRMADFSDEKNVERQVERASDFGGNENAAARESEHERVVVNVRGEVAGECLAGLAAVAIAVDGRHCSERDRRRCAAVREKGWEKLPNGSGGVRDFALQ